eukprot:PhF_6_TR36512/c0_g1_i3/m.53765
MTRENSKSTFGLVVIFIITSALFLGDMVTWNRFFPRKLSVPSTDEGTINNTIDPDIDILNTIAFDSLTFVSKSRRLSDVYNTVFDITVRWHEPSYHLCAVATTPERCLTQGSLVRFERQSNKTAYDGMDDLIEVLKRHGPDVLTFHAEYPTMYREYRTMMIHQGNCTYRACLLVEHITNRYHLFMKQYSTNFD